MRHVPFSIHWQGRAAAWAPPGLRRGHTARAGRPTGIHPLVLVFVFCAALALGLPSQPAQANPANKITIDCNNITVKDCLSLFKEQSRLSVNLADPVVSSVIYLRLKNSDAVSGLSEIVEAANIQSYAILYNMKNNLASVSTFNSRGAPEGQPFAPPDKGTPATLSPKAPEKTGSLSVPKEPLLVGENSPNPEAVIGNGKVQLGPDEEVELPDGEKVSVREMQARLSKAAQMSVPPDEPLLEQGDGLPALTARDMKQRQKEAEESIRKVQEIELPDGTVVSLRQQKKPGAETPAGERPPAVSLAPPGQGTDTGSGPSQSPTTTSEPVVSGGSR